MRFNWARTYSWPSVGPGATEWRRIIGDGVRSLGCRNPGPVDSILVGHDRFRLEIVIAHIRRLDHGARN